MVTDRHKGANLALGNATNKWSPKWREGAQLQEAEPAAQEASQATRSRWVIDREAPHAIQRLVRRSCLVRHVEGSREKWLIREERWRLLSSVDSGLW